MRPTTHPDRRTVAAFERSTAALGRSTGRVGAADHADAPLAAELRSSLLLFAAVLGMPLLLVILLAT